MESQIMVTIGCITYNHEKYIEKAIQSFLMQECKYKYEIIIHDDASLDNTAKIIKKYEEKYPDIIKGIYQTENQYSKGIMTSQIVRNAARGKYIAFCEGDDYWIDKKKIEEQVEFLENNPDYIATGHWCNIVDKYGKISNQYKNADKVFNFKENEYTLRHYKKDMIPAHINTIMHRNIYLNSKYDYNQIYKASRLVGDRTTILILALSGRINIEHKVMSVYRFVIDEKGSYSSKIINQNRCYEWYLYYKKLEEYILKIMQIRINLSKLKCQHFINSIIYYLKTKDLEDKKVIYRIWKDCNKKDIILYFPISIINKIKFKIQ
ncbi:glycosyltransferase family 2 protein [Clostridium thermobutyricum]|uniref:Putative glycosyltransferase EpsE n=1 Tax=Clostridium thermobutyricum DSM 4928 TaxID=1121339 RepID=A0A1V4T0G7_9CLOT|nr:glycosyltransferase family 2 protein [Clostridium thermobutyricum]OPX50368.1 putative glycosyltransferase EpsE [Clostridium thermobutyricum DSM 4928]